MEYSPVMYLSDRGNGHPGGGWSDTGAGTSRGRAAGSVIDNLPCGNPGGQGGGGGRGRGRFRSSITSGAETPPFRAGRSAGNGAVGWMRTEDAAGRAVAGGNPGDACGGAVRLRLGTAEADIPGSWCR